MHSLLLLILLTGCSTLEHSAEPLYKQYSQYKKTTNRENILLVAPNYFSENILENDYATQPYITDFLLFKDSMEKEKSYHEKINGNKGCLTINGYNDKQELVIFSLEYVRSTENWLINFIATIYDEKEPAKTAFCPNEYAS